MVDKYALESKSSPLLKKIIALLSELNQSRQGRVFYNHIRQALEDWEASQLNTVDTYAGLINLLLDAFASQLPPQSVALAHLKLVQTCLTPPHSEAELGLLQHAVEQTADILKHSCHIDPEELNNTLAPLFQQVTDSGAAPHFPQPTPKEAKKGKDHLQVCDTPDAAEVAATDLPPAWVPQAVDSDSDDYVAHDDNSAPLADADHAQRGASGHRPLKAPRAVLKMLRFPEQDQDSAAHLHDTSDSAQFPDMEETVSQADRDGDETLHPDDHVDYPVLSEAASVPDGFDAPDSEEESAADFFDNNDEDVLQSGDGFEMERLHRDFVHHMRSIMAENAAFGVHLGLEIDALDDAGKGNHIEERRNAILGSLKKLSQSHAELAQKFDTAQTYLSIMESDKQKLSDELDRARKLSLTDDLTSLPNRRAFMRRMDDEVSRVKRYGFPLSLVLIDIDHFKQVNDEYGHVAGDAVLRAYADKILSVFRHHDMIARYGGEEFAVLLPNTELDGVLRALDKARGRVARVECHIGGFAIAAPTFSAGVAEYRAPETPSHFIERADHALYRAKRMGRNRIEVEQKDHEHGAMDQT